MIKTDFFFPIVLIFLGFFGCNSSNEIVVREDFLNQEQQSNADSTNTTNSKPLFINSIASTNIDFIKSTDPDTFISISFLGRFQREMPGTNTNVLVDPNSFVFEALFTDNKKISIWCHSSFQTIERATDYANKLTDKLGKLPVFMRDELSHVVVHYGSGGAFAEDRGKFFVIFSERIDKRISENDLEETVFHETCHITFDVKYAKSQEWKEIQKTDGVFITEYAESRQDVEDIAETAIFVYTMKNYPERLSEDVKDWVKTNVPNRYKFIEKLFQ